MPTQILLIIIAGLFVLSFIFGGKSSRSHSIKRNLAKQKYAAMHRRPDRKSLRRKPESGDIVLGKYHGKYTFWDSARDGHFLVVGGSGTGKTSGFVIPTLMSCPDVPVLALDIKPELATKSGRINDPRTIVFNPTDHGSWGFDPFFTLSENSNQQLVFETMQTITHSLIPLTGSKDQFWPEAARNITLGLMVYHWNKGIHDLIGIIDSIYTTSIRDQITEVTSECPPSSIEFRQLIQYNSLADETIFSISATINNCLVFFTVDSNLRWAFSGAEKKCSPLSLEEGKSIFLTVPEHKLSAYSKALAMVVNLTLDSLSRRPENSPRIFIVLDELARVVSSGGSMDRLIDASMTLRSRNVTLMIILQQIESLEAGFSKAQVTTLVGNCAVKIIFDASSSETQRMVCEDWIPQFLLTNPSTSSGSKSSSYSESFKRMPAVEKADLLELRNNRELIAITPKGFTTLKICSYYDDCFFKKSQESVDIYGE